MFVFIRCLRKVHSALIASFANDEQRDGDEEAAAYPMTAHVSPAPDQCKLFSSLVHVCSNRKGALCAQLIECGANASLSSLQFCGRRFVDRRACAKLRDTPMPGSESTLVGRLLGGRGEEEKCICHLLLCFERMTYLT